MPETGKSWLGNVRHISSSHALCCGTGAAAAVRLLSCNMLLPLDAMAQLTLLICKHTPTPCCAAAWAFQRDPSTLMVACV